MKKIIFYLFTFILFFGINNAFAQKDKAFVKAFTESICDCPKNQFKDFKPEFHTIFASLAKDFRKKGKANLDGLQAYLEKNTTEYQKFNDVLVNLGNNEECAMNYEKAGFKKEEIETLLKNNLNNIAKELSKNKKCEKGYVIYLLWLNSVAKK